MTLLIACILLWQYDWPWYWYLISFLIWLAHEYQSFSNFKDLRELISVDRGQK